MASAIVSIIVIGVLTLIPLVLVGMFALPILQPKLADFLHAPFGPKYTPCVAVCARIDGGITYRENNLKRIPLGKDFFLKFDVSIRRRWLYWGDKKFAVTIENKEPDKLVMDAIEYSGEKAEPGDTFVIVVSKHTGKNTIVFRCKPPVLSATLVQVTIKSDDRRLEPLNKTIALVFVTEPSKTENTTTKVSIDGTVTVKTE